jgi:hypothetical protein
MIEESQASAVSVVTEPRAGSQRDPIATSDKRKRFFLSANPLDWGKLSLIFNGFWDLLLRGKAVGV